MTNYQIIQLLQEQEQYNNSFAIKHLLNVQKKKRSSEVNRVLQVYLIKTILFSLIILRKSVRKQLKKKCKTPKTPKKKRTK